MQWIQDRLVGVTVLSAGSSRERFDSTRERACCPRTEDRNSSTSHESMAAWASSRLSRLLDTAP